MEFKNNCPFCGSSMLYEEYAILDGYTVPIIFCDTCKFIFTVEGSEDYITDTNDGFMRLREEWNTRDSRSCYADEVTHHNCKYSVNRGWCEHTCKRIKKDNPADNECSECGFYLMYMYSYCPNCGAKIID